ncbi:hypothetical protein V498_00913 [Pseudogymnoascus sp. VKM F-4517 (FW-2822)]|nr:hypothetical protein V498_00913 [Pseudogymnoascus sp. VKM F-4517 (FW-2822)]
MQILLQFQFEVGGGGGRALEVDGAWRDERMFDRGSADAVVGWSRGQASGIMGCGGAGEGIQGLQGSEGAHRRDWRLAVGDN